MTWKDYLKDKGFSYSTKDEVYFKSLGFGRRLEVEMLMKGLFEMREGRKILFSNYIESFNEFKEKINNIL